MGFQVRLVKHIIDEAVADLNMYIVPRVHNIITLDSTNLDDFSLASC